MLNKRLLTEFWMSCISRCNFKIIKLSLLMLLISGCASEKFGDDNSHKKTAPSSLPKGPVALVLGDSATETAKELSAYNRRYKSGVTGDLYMDSIRQAYVDTSDPEFSIAEVIRMLDAKFGKVERFQTVDEAAHGGSKLIVKLDMHTRLINDRSSDPASYLSLEFSNLNHQYLGTLESMSRRTLTPVWTGYKREKEIVSDIRQQGEIQAHALELLERKLSDVTLED
ncbi:hypothetical protein [Pseudomonas syringae group genomosp. 3]|uniref:Lipoprotein n=2 Tax=Pseudomonas TaxID=286 RepID=A0A0P9TAF5_PSEYM|nr:hypothetical protein [Pseudomonas syringae group genomosp. 3]RMM06747.1 hypothetical protein ALQ85_101762 [Pseudomonas syringae]KPX67817.1 hypothetical protein ALO84_101562 [Pseudomonas syringae pv. maculicola]RMM75482.1 hypothetical protein ALQ72_02804 [Pseudomonas syringae pv. maculicola]RMO84572.1 hypothetical protein ALQ34_102531 [Pseudomonas syringae pv. maculicola]RMV40175.1 hypothetical protein ALP13_102589 [Pseudomonas syringae pv. maculicola]